MPFDQVAVESEGQGKRQKTERHGFPVCTGNDGGRGRGAAGVLSPGGSRMAVLESVGDARFVHCAALSFTVIGKRPGG